MASFSPSYFILTTPSSQSVRNNFDVFVIHLTFCDSSTKLSTYCPRRARRARGSLVACTGKVSAHRLWSRSRVKCASIRFLRGRRLHNGDWLLQAFSVRKASEFAKYYTGRIGAHEESRHETQATCRQFFLLLGIAHHDCDPTKRSAFGLISIASWKGHRQSLSLAISHHSTHLVRHSGFALRFLCIICISVVFYNVRDLNRALDGVIKPVYAVLEVYGRRGSAHLFSHSIPCFGP